MNKKSVLFTKEATKPTNESIPTKKRQILDEQSNTKISKFYEQSNTDKKPKTEFYSYSKIKIDKNHRLESDEQEVYWFVTADTMVTRKLGAIGDYNEHLERYIEHSEDSFSQKIPNITNNSTKTTKSILSRGDVRKSYKINNHIYYRHVQMRWVEYEIIEFERSRLFGQLFSQTQTIHFFELFGVRV